VVSQLPIQLCAEVQALLAANLQLDAATITPQSRLVEDLYADSLELLDLVLDLNAHYGIEIGADDLLQMTTVSAVVAVVERLLSPAGQVTLRQIVAL
jgi:acyl carrier protein